VGTTFDLATDRPRPRRAATAELTQPEIAALRALMVAAYGSDEEERFTDDDWDHAVGGMHFVLELDGEVVTHASVVERELHVGGHPLRTGYVEAVATAPGREGRGYGSLVMEAVTSYIRDAFELGALGTGRQRFYERLGWVTWTGPASVRTGGGTHRTPDEDGYIMVLTTRSSPPLDLAAPISCEWRPGDVW
jgi:aminoglycoside 2'-N-acetyltransferase I